MKSFKYFDLNDNGVVEPDEFAKAIEKIGIQIPTRGVSELFLSKLAFLLALHVHFPPRSELVTLYQRCNRQVSIFRPISALFQDGAGIGRSLMLFCRAFGAFHAASIFVALERYN